jgi:hypothetical protein
MLWVFFDANRIRLHTGLPRARFFNTPFFPSTSLASPATGTSTLAPGPFIAAQRGAAWTLAWPTDTPRRGAATASSTWLERLAAAAPPGCSRGAQDAGARENAMLNNTTTHLTSAKGASELKQWCGANCPSVLTSRKSEINNGDKFCGARARWAGRRRPWFGGGGAVTEINSQEEILELAASRRVPVPGLFVSEKRCRVGVVVCPVPTRPVSPVADPSEVRK